MDIIINNDVKKRLKRGAGFGELALLYNAPRSASVKAVGKFGAWAIDRHTFRKVVEEMAQKQYQENLKFMENVKFYSLFLKEILSN